MSTSAESPHDMPLASDNEPQSPTKPLASHGLHLQVNFLWTKFRNEISAKRPNGSVLPLYVMHRRPTKPQLRYERASDKTYIGKGSINTFSISGDCIIHGQEVILKPLKRWKTQYNYLSHALGGLPVSWIADCTLKLWNFVCINSDTQEPIAKFSVNFWALKEVGNIYFAKFEEAIDERLRDEVVITGLTLLYIMTTRINNPFNLPGAAFAKPGRVEGDKNSTASSMENEPVMQGVK